MKKLKKCGIGWKRAGFSLLEVIMVVVIIVILSLISGPIYNGYSTNAKQAEGYALLGTILSAQQTYRNDTGVFLSCLNDKWKQHNFAGTYGTCNSEVLGIDARGNKYYTLFNLGNKNGDYIFTAYAYAANCQPIIMEYNATGGGATYL